MIDVKSCKKIELQGQEVKKIVDSLGRVLYEVSGPGPTPTYHDWTDDEFNEEYGGYQINFNTPYNIGRDKSTNITIVSQLKNINADVDLTQTTMSDSWDHITIDSEQHTRESSSLWYHWKDVSVTGDYFSGSIYLISTGGSFTDIKFQHSISADGKTLTVSILRNDNDEKLFDIDYKLLVEGVERDIETGTFNTSFGTFDGAKTASSVVYTLGTSKPSTERNYKIYGTCVATAEPGYSIASSYHYCRIGFKNTSGNVTGTSQFYFSDKTATENRITYNSTEYPIALGLHKSTISGQTITRVEWDETNLQLKGYNASDTLLITVQFNSTYPSAWEAE